MSKVIIDVPDDAQEIRESILNKGELEVCSRNAMKRFSSFAKCAVSVASEDDHNLVWDAAYAAMQIDDLDAEIWVERQRKQQIQMDLNYALEEIRSLTSEKEDTGHKLDVLIESVPTIFRSVEDLRNEAWLCFELSLANLKATNSGNKVISRKLEFITQQCFDIDKKIDEALKYHYEETIKQPCDNIVMLYGEITSSLKQGKLVSDEKLMGTIRLCSITMNTIFGFRNNIDFDKALGLLFGLLPLLTDLILLYYVLYYNNENKLHDSHNNWVRIYKLLESQEFRNDLQKYLLIGEKRKNLDANRIMAYLFLKNEDYQRRIQNVLSDLEKCGSTLSYLRAVEASKSKENKMMEKFNNQLVNKLGEQDSEWIVVKARERCQEEDVVDSVHNIDWSRLYALQMQEGQENTCKESKLVADRRFEQKKNTVGQSLEA